MIFGIQVYDEDSDVVRYEVTSKADIMYEMMYQQ